jgi:ribose transport system substrate-binding protein
MTPLRILKLLAIALLIAAVPACSKNSSQTRVAFITNNPYDFWKIAQRGTEAAEKDFNVACEFRMPSRGGSEEQRTIIEDLTAKGIKGIAISPNDAENQTEYFAKVNKQVPVITQDSDLPDPKARRCYIGTDNYTAGRGAGELVKKAAPEGGKVVIYVGKLDVQNAVERRHGVLDALAGREKGKPPAFEKNLTVGKYTVLDTMTDNNDKDECQRKVEDTLTKNPDVVCLVGLWEYNPPAILRAVNKSKLDNKPAIVGFDENDETLDGITEDKIVGTIVQNPWEFGYQAVEILTALAKGDDGIIKKKGADDQGRIFVPHRVITKDNVEAFRKELKEKKAGTFTKKAEKGS